MGRPQHASFIGNEMSWFRGVYFSEEDPLGCRRACTFWAVKARVTRLDGILQRNLLGWPISMPLTYATLYWKLPSAAVVPSMPITFVGMSVGEGSSTHGVCCAYYTYVHGSRRLGQTGTIEDDTERRDGTIQWGLRTSPKLRSDDGGCGCSGLHIAAAPRAAPLLVPGIDSIFSLMPRVAM
ncbi:hypothetical protein LZ32DRAFT_278279 [Colletotrichum eremochloae]|nr:hypothetical protein LZ32DRAFT_278279 [Colletotrichum eremochloae]